LDASEGWCVDQGSSEDLDLISFVLRNGQGKVKEQRGGCLNWQNHKFRVKVEKC